MTPTELSALRRDNPRAFESLDELRATTDADLRLLVLERVAGWRWAMTATRRVLVPPGIALHLPDWDGSDIANHGTGRIRTCNDPVRDANEALKLAESRLHVTLRKQCGRWWVTIRPNGRSRQWPTASNESLPRAICEALLIGATA